MLTASLAVGRFLLYCVRDKPNHEVEARGDGSEMVKISTELPEKTSGTFAWHYATE